MGNLLYVIAILRIIGWAVGFIAFSAGAIIHVLLILAAIVVIISLLQGKKAF